MSARNKTGGGTGTNQYQIRGNAKPGPVAPDMPMPVTETPPASPRKRRKTAERKAQASDPDTPYDSLLQLADDVSPSVRGAVVSRAQPLDDQLCDILRRRGGVAIIEKLLRRPECPDHIVAHYAGVPKYGNAILDRESIPHQAWHGIRLWSNDSSVVERMLERVDCPPDVLEEMSLHNMRHSKYQWLVARHPRCPPDTLIELTRSSDPWTQRAALENDNLPAHIRVMHDVIGPKPW